MKKYCPILISILVCIISSCQKPNTQDTPETPEEKPLYSVVGVWREGNYLVSFNKDGFYSSYLGKYFIDNGSYKITNNDYILCDNYYYDRKTRFDIVEINEKKLTVKVSSVDVFGKDYEQKLSLQKTDIEPKAEKHQLTTKSYSWMSQTGTVTQTFATSDTGIKSSTGTTQSTCPLKFFYVYIGDHAYCQYDYLSERKQIGGWSTRAENKEVQALKIAINHDGTMNFADDSDAL